MHDESDELQQRRQREALLAIMLALAGGGVILFILIFLSFGIFLYVLIGAIGIALFALFHYLLWGRILSQDTAGEREEEELRQKADDEGWPLPDPNRRASH